MKILAKSKLKSIKLINSKTIQECCIFEHCYGCINDEVNSYDKLKEEIRKKIKSRLTDFERKRLIKYRCKESVDEFIKNINNDAMCKWKILQFHTLEIKHELFFNYLW